MIKNIIINTLATIGGISIIFIISSILFTKGNVRDIYLYVGIITLLFGIICGGLFTFIHTKFEISKSIIPQVSILISFVVLAQTTWYLTTKFFNISLNIFGFYIQFALIFFAIYGVIYYISQKEAKEINVLINKNNI